MPRKTGPQPTAMDRLDPAPPTMPPAPPVPRPRRPRPGLIGQAVNRDLRLLPDELRRGGIAAGALRLAMELDAGIVIGRDAAGHAREIRQSLTTLREMAPGERRGDKNDDLAARREKRLTASAE